MRAFVAVELRSEEASARAPEHLTLKFLGEIGEPEVRLVRERLGPLGPARVPFRIVLEGVGAFPSPQRPRVVWQGVGAGRAELEELAGAVRTALAPPFPPEPGPFVPHLTLFRVRSAEDRRAAAELLAGSRPAPPPRSCEVREFVLKESVLGRGGAVHRTVAAFRLGTAGNDPG